MMKFILSGAALCLVAACAGHAPPVENLASATGAVNAARQAGADRVPSASLHLELAEEQLAQAKRMMEDGMNDRANAMTIRAYNDAQLANSLAREAEAHRRYDAVSEVTQSEVILEEQSAKQTSGGESRVTEESVDEIDEISVEEIDEGSEPLDKSTDEMGAKPDEQSSGMDSDESE